jgi:V8-like Glu-specific endopeptidase
MFGLFGSIGKKMSRAREERRSRLKHQRGFQPTLELLDQRVLPSLTPVPAHTIYPYTAVVEVQVTFPDHKTFVGSGAMIDSFHALTAAHMLYSYADGGWPTSIRVIPDMYYSSNPYGMAWGTTERVDPSWISWSRGHPDQISTSAVDIGLVTLNSTIGYRTGWFGLNYNNDPFFINQYFETAGYPASNGYNGQQMYYSFGRVTGVQGNDLLSTEGNITNIPGQSGSPLWYTGNNCIYAVNSGWNGNMAAGTQDFFARITPSVFNELQSWRNSDRMPSSTTAFATDVVAGSNPGVRSSTVTVSTPQTLTSARLSIATDARLPALLGGTHSDDTAVVGKGRHASVDTVFAPTEIDGFSALGRSNF